MGELLKQTLSERRRWLGWWSLSLLGLTAMFIAFYPSVRDASGLSEYSRELPEAVRALFTGGELDLASGPGYLNSQVFESMAPLVLLILAIGAGANLLAGDEERGRLELLLSQPLRREQLVLERLGAMAVLVAAATLVLFLGLAVGAPIVDLEVGTGRLAAATASVGLLALLYGAIALAVGAIRPGKGRAIAVAAGLAIGAWILDGFGQAIAGLEPWRPVSPFYQALGSDPLREGVPLAGWSVLLGMTAVAGLAAVWGLRRRDVSQ